MKRTQLTGGGRWKEKAEMDFGHKGTACAKHKGTACAKDDGGEKASSV